MGILSVLLIGLAVGALARFLTPGPERGGIVLTTLLGIAGALAATFLGRKLGWYPDSYGGAGLVASVVGAMALLLVYRVVSGRRALRT